MAVSRKSKRSVMTIPQLRQSMTHISHYAQSLVKSKKPNAVKAFQSEWQATFHKPLSDKVAKEYLKHIAKYKSKTMKRGGMAPLAYRMEPGATLPHGNFPEYLTKGFFVPMSTNIANCGLVDSTVKPSPDLGSNVVSKGGSLKKRNRNRNRKTRKGGGDNPIASFVQGLTTISTRPFSSQNPPTFQHELLMTQKGYLPSPGSDPSNKSWSYVMPSQGIVPLPAAITNPVSPLVTVTPPSA